jgi:hypothetical protein
MRWSWKDAADGGWSTENAAIKKWGLQTSTVVLNKPGAFQ